MYTKTEFARFNLNSSEVPQKFTGGKINVELLIFMKHEKDNVLESLFIMYDFTLCVNSSFK